MKKEVVYFFTIIGVVLMLATFLMVAKKETYSKKIKIAACPTCYKLVKDINIEKYEFVPTKSTAASIDMLKNGQVDVIFAGRTLKPNEPQYSSLLISNGYSFLASKSITLDVKDLENYAIYTDLDSSKVKTLFNIDNVTSTQGVYKYLPGGIVVTSWENTDYTKAEMVNLLEETGDRVLLSRRPTLYCPSSCNQDAKKIAHLITSINFKTEGEQL